MYDMGKVIKEQRMLQKMTQEPGRLCPEYICCDGRTVGKQL